MNQEKYTDRMRGFLQSAQMLALREGHQRFVPDHILKVLLDDPEGLAANLIQSSGGDSRAVHRAVEASLAKLPKQTLRDFAAKKGPELKDCVPEPDRGPTLKLGVAFEIGSDGAVDFVQILGADGSARDVKRCYAAHLKRWRFPEELLRGEEKLLVNYVL